MNYKTLLIIPSILLIFSIAVLVNGFYQTGEWFSRSIELKGGTLITISSTEVMDLSAIEQALSGFEDISIRELRSFAGYSALISTTSEADSQAILRKRG